MRRTSIKRLTLTLAVAAVVVALAVAVVLVMGGLHRAAKAADVVAIDETAVEKDYPAVVVVQARLDEVDLDREVVTLQLELLPMGSDLYDPASGTLKDELSVRVSDGANPGIGETTVIAAGDQGAIVPVTLDLAGNTEDYPRDVHSGSLLLIAFRQPAGGGEPQELPILLQAYGAWPGLAIGFTTPPSQFDTAEVTARELHVTVERSRATVTVVYFAVALTWVLIVTVIGMTMSVVLGQREPQLVMLAFFGTLLFGLTEFRNMLPGAPPSGAYSDYLAFYWAYGVVIVAVAVIGGLWLYRRSAQRERPAAPAGQDEIPADPADFG